MTRTLMILSFVAGSAAIAAVALAGGAADLSPAAAEMAKAADAFLAGLTPEQKAKACFEFGDAERLNWHFIPRSRKGLPIKEMTEAQRKAAHALLSSGLSQSGYKKATTIMSLETIIKELEGPNSKMVRDPELYYVTVFGDPSAKGAWGWRLEGHHVSLRFAVDNGKLLVSSTPQFLGSNPAEVPYGYGPYTGLRVLAAQEDAARTLVLALDPKRQAIAIVAPNPRGFASGTRVKFDPQAPVGLPMAQMTAAQRDMLMKLIDSYASIMPADIAAARLAKIKSAGTGTIAFAWSGSTEKGRQYQYQVQGPTFLIEHNNTQNNGNHVHSVWRDFNGDFGRDILAEHMAMFRH